MCDLRIEQGLQIKTMNKNVYLTMMFMCGYCKR